MDWMTVIQSPSYCNSLLAGMSVQLHDWLQSVLNAAARLICTARKTDHISPLVMDLHWLPVHERVKFKLRYVCWRIAYTVSSRHGTAVPRRPPGPHVCWWQPTYVTSGLHADSPTLVIRPSRRSTLGDHAFPVAAARAWNSLPPAVRDAPSLLSFRSRLKTWLFELTL